MIADLAAAATAAAALGIPSPPCAGASLPGPSVATPWRWEGGWRREKKDCYQEP
jgi:hypothetical protein